MEDDAPKKLSGILLLDKPTDKRGEKITAKDISTELFSTRLSRRYVTLLDNYTDIQHCKI